MSTKERLLSHLKGKKGEWVSGEALSRKLRISRSAVWKHMARLRQEGYGIESSPRKGYRLQEISTRPLPNEIREGLKATLFGQKPIYYHREIDSTNRRAKELAVEGAPEGTLVISERQTRGRGRQKRNWYSPPQEGIYLSLILKPALPPNEIPGITMLTAVALAEALLSEVKLHPRIKWPNDILVNGKKVAGILTEISTDMESVNHVVVGTGLNVNTGRFPEDIREKATSLFLETGKIHSRVPLIRAYLTWYEIYYTRFQQKGFKPVLNRWNELTDIIGRRIRVQTIGRTYIGEARGVDDQGLLLLKDRAGRLHRVIAGDIVYL